MNQFGFIFWMLLSFYLLLEAFRTDHVIGATLLTAAACFFEQMSLFSYESQLLLLLPYPIVLLALRRRWRKWLLISAAWYVVPAYYFKLTAAKYLHSSGSTYQTILATLQPFRITDSSATGGSISQRASHSAVA
jgi:hypothetical protein